MPDEKRSEAENPYYDVDGRKVDATRLERQALNRQRRKRLRLLVEVEISYDPHVLWEGYFSSRRRRRLATYAALSFALSLLLWALFSLSSCPGMQAFRRLTSMAQSDAQRNPTDHPWAAYSPYFDAGEYTSVPKGCAVTQVNIVRRD